MPTPNTPTLTDPIYWASKDPRVVALQQLKVADGDPDLDARITGATALDAGGTGLIIDWPIDIWGWSPTLVMGARAAYGYVWAPSGFQPNPPLPQLADASLAYPRSIKVSINAADYPAFAPPIAAPPLSTSPIGPLNGTLYGVNIAAAQLHGTWLFADGQQFQQGAQTFTFHNQPGMFGPMVWWTLNTPSPVVSNL